MKSLFSIAVLIAALSFSPSGAEAERFKLQLSNFGGSGQAGNPQGWQAWAPRAELQPRCYVDTANSAHSPVRWRSPEMAMPLNTVVGATVFRRFSLDATIV